MKRVKSMSRATRMIVAVAICAFTLNACSTSHSCTSSAPAVAEAYVRANPMYAWVIGDLRSFVSENREHFRAGSDAVRCAAALSEAIMTSSNQLYDPKQVARKRMIDARLGAIGVSPGQPQPSMSQSDLYLHMSMQLSRLAKTLPALANDDDRPWYTPTNQFEQQQILGERYFKQIVQNPTVGWAFKQNRTVLLQGAQIERQIIVIAASRLAKLN